METETTTAPEYTGYEHLSGADLYEAHEDAKALAQALKKYWRFDDMAISTARLTKRFEEEARLTRLEMDRRMAGTAAPAISQRNLMKSADGLLGEYQRLFLHLRDLRIDPDYAMHYTDAVREYVRSRKEFKLIEDEIISRIERHESDASESVTPTPPIGPDDPAYYNYEIEVFMPALPDNEDEMREYFPDDVSWGFYRQLRACGSGRLSAYVDVMASLNFNHRMNISE